MLPLGKRFAPYLSFRYIRVFSCLSDFTLSRDIWFTVVWRLPYRPTSFPPLSGFGSPRTGYIPKRRRCSASSEPPLPSIGPPIIQPHICFRFCFRLLGEQSQAVEMLRMGQPTVPTACHFRVAHDLTPPHHQLLLQTNTVKEHGREGEENRRMRRLST